ncbi:MAG: ComEA family DNA-binding protein [Janibacter sp.]|nr:ComEA family DNA-binding protein [Janibacter sp.]
MSRASEPSVRVTEILDEDRDPRPLELPATLAAGRYGVSRQAIIGVALVVALAVAMLGGRYLLARGDAAPQPVTMGEGSEPGPSADTLPGAGPTTPTAAAGATTAARVTVHVVGEVERPGVVTLASGSRVDDALDEAGGATSEADLSGVNLARPLVDGEQVVVPAPGEAAVGAPPGAGGPAGAPPGAAGPGGGASLVNLNTADLATLETLPGVGPVLAQRILDWRTEHGQFTAIEELGEVSGVGDKTYAQLSPKVTV